MSDKPVLEYDSRANHAPTAKDYVTATLNAVVYFIFLFVLANVARFMLFGPDGTDNFTLVQHIVEGILILGLPLAVAVLQFRAILRPRR